jgi:hypothetical protein
MSIVRFSGASSIGTVAAAEVLDLTALWLGAAVVGTVGAAYVQDFGVTFLGASVIGVVGTSELTDGQIINTVLLQGVSVVGVVASGDALLGFAFPPVVTPAAESDVPGSAMSEMGQAGSMAGEVT